VPRVPVVGFLLCLAVGLILASSAPAASPKPTKHCSGTVSALRGTGCKVGQWVCYSPNPLPPKLPRGSYEQVCLHVLADPHGPVRRLTSIFFRETDHDHA
jgi:hypothetical protein